MIEVKGLKFMCNKVNLSEVFPEAIIFLQKSFSAMIDFFSEISNSRNNIQGRDVSAASFEKIIYYNFSSQAPPPKRENYFKSK